MGGAISLGASGFRFWRSDFAVDVPELRECSGDDTARPGRCFSATTHELQMQLVQLIISLVNRHA